VADLVEITGALTTVGGVVTLPAAVVTAIGIANQAVTALNAYQASVQSGASTTTSVVAGYTAIKTAQVATAQAALAVAGTTAKAS